jgi:hypothetical protein
VHGRQAQAAVELAVASITHPVSGFRAPDVGTKNSSFPGFSFRFFFRRFRTLLVQAQVRKSSS